MKGERDEGKQMVPLFPGLRISDGDKGGPRAPPRNKMALFEEYSVTSQGPELRPVPRPLLPSGNGCGTFVSQASSSNVSWRNLCLVCFLIENFGLLSCVEVQLELLDDVLLLCVV